uniref:VWFA domain-containing protein n=1 Tax=Neolamprologus brichardi TaxID=32507 RepID=A0A3Q4GKN7_NEOBR
NSKTTLTSICFSSTACKDIPSDIFFLTDSSESISEEDFQKMKNFTKSVISKSSIGLDKVHVGFMQYSTNRRLEFDLTKHYNLEGMLNTIDVMEQMNEGTRTGRAITEVSQYFDAARGGRPWMKQWLVVITDGKSQDSVKEPAHALRAKGVVIHAIGVDKANRKELSEISGSSQRVFIENTFDALKELETKLALKFCEKDCKKTVEADIIFLVDGSESINKEHVVDNFNVSKEFAHVGLAQFSADPKHEFYLNTYNDKTKMIEHILNMNYKGGNTYLGEALDHIRDYFHESNGGRRDVPKNLVLITDGNSKDDVEDAAEALRKMGITIFAIAVGDVYYLQLLQITGTPEKVFNVENFDSLANIKTKIIDEICDTVLNQDSQKIQFPYFKW